LQRRLPTLSQKKMLTAMMMFAEKKKKALFMWRMGLLAELLENVWLLR